MTFMPIGDLFKKTGSIYKLSVLASKRAIQLNDGAVPLTKKKFYKLSSVALQEIKEGKITYRAIVKK
ncbi:MAG: DNA-directed RNA polymerase subunit omega [Candidatus Omnitrophota bacterium]